MKHRERPPDRFHMNHFMIHILQSDNFTLKLSSRMVLCCRQDAWSGWSGWVKKLQNASAGNGSSLTQKTSMLEALHRQRMRFPELLNGLVRNSWNAIRPVWDKYHRYELIGTGRLFQAVLIRLSSGLPKDLNQEKVYFKEDSSLFSPKIHKLISNWLIGCRVL